jgi:hypothetical protein
MWVSREIWESLWPSERPFSPARYDGFWPFGDGDLWIGYKHRDGKVMLGTVASCMS